jgi:hypothetical protein
VSVLSMVVAGYSSLLECVTEHCSLPNKTMSHPTTSLWEPQVSQWQLVCNVDVPLGMWNWKVFMVPQRSEMWSWLLLMSLCIVVLISGWNLYAVFIRHNLRKLYIICTVLCSSDITYVNCILSAPCCVHQT